MDAKDIFLRSIEQMLGMQECSLTGDEALAEIQAWDSLAVLGVIALAEGDYNKKLQLQDIVDAKTVADIFDVLSSQ